MLSGLASAVLAHWPPPAQGRTVSGPLTLDAFIALSAQLTHRPADSLDRDMAQRMLDAFQPPGQPDALTRLAQDAASAPALAMAVRAAWFSGLIPGHDIPPVGYAQALVWSAAPFLHAPGICGGPTGYWAQPPAAR